MLSPEALANYDIRNIVGADTLIGLFIFGAFVFGLSGGLAGVAKRLDFFGVLLLSGVVGLSGGAIRDLFLGIPAVSIFDWRTVLAVVAAGILSFVAHGELQKLHYPIQMLDAIGLSLFSVFGSAVSLLHHAGPVAAALLGLATGVSGGVARDLLLNEVPQILKSGLYAVPSLVASGLVVLGFELKILSLAWYLLAAAVCLTIRLLGIFFNVNLPRAKQK